MISSLNNVWASTFPAPPSRTTSSQQDIYYIYRWAGTGSYHMSQFGNYKAGENVGHDQVETFIQQRANRGEIRQGAIPLQPCWQTDYRQLVASYIATLAEEQAQAPS